MTPTSNRFQNCELPNPYFPKSRITNRTLPFSLINLVVVCYRERKELNKDVHRDPYSSFLITRRRNPPNIPHRFSNACKGLTLEVEWRTSRPFRIPGRIPSATKRAPKNQRNWSQFLKYVFTDSKFFHFIFEKSPQDVHTTILLQKRHLDRYQMLAIFFKPCFQTSRTLRMVASYSLVHSYQQRTSEVTSPRKQFLQLLCIPIGRTS